MYEEALTEDSSHALWVDLSLPVVLEDLQSILFAEEWDTPQLEISELISSNFP